jgi:opacity protein-like surface antigen
MLKKISVIAALSLSSLTFAQEIKFGATAGFGMSTIQGDSTDTAELGLAYSLGALAIIDLGAIELQPEAVFSSRGYGVKDQEGIENLGVHLNYIDVNILGNYAITPELSVLVGPQVGFLLAARSNYTVTSEGGQGDSSKGDKSVDVKENLNTIDFGLILGGQFDITSNIFIGVRTTYGLTDVSKTAEGQKDTKNNNFSFGVMAGYLF